MKSRSLHWAGSLPHLVGELRDAISIIEPRRLLRIARGPDRRCRRIDQPPNAVTAFQHRIPLVPQPRAPESWERLS
jgi:hypothetical protein